jgi:peroxiredoxin
MKTNYKLITIVLIAFFVICQAGLAQQPDFAKLGIETGNSHIPQGLKVGDKAPEFTGYDQTGKTIQSKALLEKGPVVLFFYRGNWCPACNKYLQAYQDSLNMITDQGFSLVAITPESIENVEQTVKVHKISYTVIYDCQEKIMKDYDLMFDVSKEFREKVLKAVSIDIAKHNGRDVAHLPVTATYIINRFGVISAVQFDYDYKNRATVKWMLQNLGKAM